jgi:ParB-like chromosome segregation protein Spo0J
MSDETTTTDLGQPFAPGGVFAGGNVRLGKPTAKDQAENERADTELRDSMRAAGWLASAGPVVKDEHGTVLVGHRRARIAAELAEELGADISLEHTVEIPFGEGAEADLARLREALLSNTGGRPFSTADRRELASYFKARGWSQDSIAAALGTSQQTVSRDLAAAGAIAAAGAEAGPELGPVTAALAEQARAIQDQAKSEGKRQRASGGGRPKSADPKPAAPPSALLQERVLDRDLPRFTLAPVKKMAKTGLNQYARLHPWDTGGGLETTDLRCWLGKNWPGANAPCAHPQECVRRWDRGADPIR